MENIIFEVSLYTDYETTIKLLQLYTKILNQYKNIWKLKCEKQFPDKQYFDLWTGAENYLRCTKQKFFIVLYKPHYINENLPILYEYDKMLKSIYHTKLCSCHDDDIILKSLYINFRYVIIVIDDEYRPRILRQCITVESCTKFLERWPNTYVNKNLCQSSIYVIDLNKMSPMFWGKKSRSDIISESDEHITYYAYFNGELKLMI